MRVFIFLFLIKLLVSQPTLTVYVNNTHSKYANFEREFIEAILSIHKRKTRKHFTVKFIELEHFSDILKRVADSRENSKRIAISSISITAERKKKFSFSVPYFKNKYCLFRSHTSKIDSTKAELRVGVLEGTSHAKSLHLFPPHLKYVYYNSFLRRLSDLDSGKIDFVIADYIDQWAYNLKLVTMLPIISNDQYGIVFPLNDPYYDSLKEAAHYYIMSPSYQALLYKHFGSIGETFLPDNVKQ
jgi:hypothetical protein